MSVWERFNNIATTDEVVQARSKFAPTEPGQYEVSLDSIEAGFSNSQLPMMKVALRRMDNKVIFYNQLLQNINNPTMSAVNIAQAVAFVEGLIGESYDFTTLDAFANKLTELSQSLVGSRFKVDVSYGAKDIEQSFAKVKILEILSDVDDSLSLTDEDVPF